MLFGSASLIFIFFLLSSGISFFAIFLSFKEGKFFSESDDEFLLELLSNS